MPFIRYTYEKDVAKYGSEPIEVTDRHAQLVVADRRGVVVDSPAELEDQLKKDLVAKAAELGIEVPSKATKPDIIKLIEDHQLVEGAP